jgi:purine-binding chemotaxis protein CheW
MSAVVRTRLNWEQARRRLQEGWEATHEAMSPGGARSRAVLDERAAALARPDASGPAAETAPWMTFVLGRGTWAVEARWVRAVAPLGRLTRIPGAPAWLSGVMDVRGEVVPVVDIRPHLSLGGAAPSAFTTLVVLGGERPDLGVAVQSASSIIELSSADILDRPELLAGQGRAWVRGVTRDALVLLDAKALLEDPSLTVEPPL